MKSLKLKALVAAVAFAAMGAAQAATISVDNFNVSPGSGTGSGGMFFSIFDPGQTQSLILNLGLTTGTFQSTNATLIDTFSVTNAALQSFIAASPNSALMQWNVGGLRNGPGIDGDMGIFTTHGNAGDTITPNTEGPLTNNGLLNGVSSAMGHLMNYVNANNPGLASSNTNISNSGAAYWLGGQWTSSFGGSLLFDNSHTGFSGGELMSYIYYSGLNGSNIAGAPLATAFSNGQWIVDPTLGKVSYVGTSVVPVPAAVWLFGSGLLGLVGIARRRSK